MRIEMVDVENTILREIDDPQCKRRDVALTYGMALRSSEPISWNRINEAIIARWSGSALEWIKNKAWGLHEGRLGVDDF